MSDEEISPDDEDVTPPPDEREQVLVGKVRVAKVGTVRGARKRRSHGASGL